MPEIIDNLLYSSSEQNAARRLLFLAVFLGFSLIAMLIIAISMLTTSQKIYDALTRSIDRVADTQAAEVIHWLDTVKKDAADLAASPAGQQLDAEGIRALFENYQQQWELSLTRIDGTIATREDGYVYDLSEGEDYQETLAGKVTLSQTLFYQNGMQPFIGVSAPILQEKKLVAEINIAAPTTALDKTLAAAQFGDTGVVYLIASHGEILNSSLQNLHSTEDSGLVPQNGPPFGRNYVLDELIDNQPSGSAVYDRGGEEFRVSYRSIPNTDWTIVVEQRESEIRSKVVPPRTVGILYLLFSAMDAVAIIIVLGIYFVEVKKPSQ